MNNCSFHRHLLVVILLSTAVGFAACENRYPPDDTVVKSNDVTTTPPPDVKQQDGQQQEVVVMTGGAQFRTNGDFFEIDTGNGWEHFYARGANLSVATPGKFPGELNNDDGSYDDYYRWLRMLSEMNANVVRIYTLHYPVFYQALDDWNSQHPGHEVYLVQGIWLDELEGGDYMSDATEQLDEEIRYVIDAVHGAVEIPHRYGKAYGKYKRDASRWLMAWLPGHEMDGTIVELSNKIWAPYTWYDGTYVRSPDPGLPIEAWVARGLDHVIMYEWEKWDQQHPVAWSNWPALDPIHHPTESDRFGQDVVDVDMGRFQTMAPYTAGLFVSYHVYPFNPEFIIYDPAYVATIDAGGQVNSYLGYLLDLKSHHIGMPLFVTEFGVPSSMGVAHINENAYNHGGYSENEQAAATVDMYNAIVESGAAGAVVFEFLDEWFKRSWMTNPTTIPLDRGRFWWDPINPEESFGLVSFYPIPGKSITVDGNAADWAGKGKSLATQAATPLSPIGDGNDEGRTITGLQVTSDPAFLYLQISVNGGSPDADGTVWQIGFSTVANETGDRQFPDSGVTVPASMGLESVLIIEPSDGVYELRVDNLYNPTDRLNGLSQDGGWPVANNDGEFVLARYIVNNDDQYIQQGGPVIPERKWYYPGVLRRGNSDQDTLTTIQLAPGIVEVRIPWHILWIADPSSHQVLADNTSTWEWETEQTPGIRIGVLSGIRNGAGVKVVDACPRADFAGTSFSSLPQYTWSGWDETSSEERIKPVYHSLTQAFGETP
jgi:hypothetical protein